MRRKAAALSVLAALIALALVAPGSAQDDTGTPAKAPADAAAQPAGADQPDPESRSDGRSRTHGVSLAPGPAVEDCRLKQFETLDLASETDGEVSVPVTLNDLPGRWLIDTGNVRSMISEATVKKLDIRERMSFTPMEMFGGRPVLQEATVDSLRIGQMSSRNFSLMVAPPEFLPSDTIGILSPDIMASYDVEFDFAAGQFKMFSQDHCPDKVVYWTHGTYAEVPFDFSANSHIVVQVEIDGKSMDAVIDTGSPKSSMSLRALKTIFGLDAKSPNVTATGNASINGLPETGTYRYPFQKLTFEGVAVANPGIVIIDDSGLPGDTPRLILGIQTLRQLHLYIAYGEHKLYVTPAEKR
jgi:predicted aspartyl protease